MGYTHYWTQRREFSKAQWDEVTTDITKLLEHALHRQEVPLGNESADLGSKPTFGPDCIAFNGIGDSGHETFLVERRRPGLEDWQARNGHSRGGGFCKTARKPYDIVVTAVLCYLSSIAETHEVISDGSASDFTLALELARQALPRLANQLDYPLALMQADRWCPPWPRVECKGFTFRFCVDGRAYITRVKDGATYAFFSHHEAAGWAQSFREDHPEATGDRLLFSPYGRFPEARWRSIARKQSEALRYMVEVVGLRSIARTELKPPAYVRPGELPVMDERRPYTFADLLKMASPAAIG